MQKANTATAFSNNGLALPTANLHTPTQHGNSLFGLQHSHPVDTKAAHDEKADTFGTNNDPAIQGNDCVGGVNVCARSLALYHVETSEGLGAISVSGDDSHSDHIIAWHIRHALGVTNVPGGVVSGAYGGTTASAGSDDIPIADLTNSFRHPLCGFGELPVVDLPSMLNF